MASWGSSWLGTWGASWGYQSEPVPDVELLGGGYSFSYPYKKIKEELEALERQKEEADERAKELQRQREALEEKKKPDDTGFIKSLQDVLDAQEELQRLYALIAIETERLRQLKDEEDALIVLMSLPFSRLTV